MMNHFKLLLLFIFIIPIGYSDAVQKKMILKRDPFFLPHVKQKKQTTISKKKLLGIMQCGDRMGAFLCRGEKNKIAFVGDEVWGYLVQSISRSEVVLKKGIRLTKLIVH